MLTEFTKVLQSTLREYDILGRYGGEEFIILFEDLPCGKVKEIVQRILEEIRDTKLQFDGKSISFTFSGGLSDSSENAEMIDKADNRLYEAKNSGRNRIII